MTNILAPEAATSSLKGFGIQEHLITKAVWVHIPLTKMWHVRLASSICLNEINGGIPVEDATTTDSVSHHGREGNGITISKTN